MKIIFLVSNAADSYFHKRIGELERLGVKVEILGFNREWYERKKYDHPCTFLGEIEQRHYFKRLLPILKAIPAVRRHLKMADIVYIFLPDMLALYCASALGLRRTWKVVFDVCDIQPVLIGNSLKSRVFRLLERILMRRIDLLVVTSEAFVTEFFQKIQGLTQVRYLVIENKLGRKSLKLPVRSQTERLPGVLRVGYFGVIRCPRSLEILKTAAERGKGRVRIYIRGASPGRIVDIEACVKENSWIEYGGPYLSPDDCPDLYGSVDIVWACYPYEGRQAGNWLWARTNRFYEACFYGKPMIVQSGAEDGRVVAEKGLGVCVDLSDINACAERILSVSPDELQRWQSNIKRLPKNTYLYTDEHQRLLNILNTSR